MAKRPFPRPGVCVTGVSRPVTMAIPFLAADTGVTSGLWRVGRPTPGHRKPAQPTTTAVPSPRRDWPGKPGL